MGRVLSLTQAAIHLSEDLNEIWVFEGKADENETLSSEQYEKLLHHFISF